MTEVPAVIDVARLLIGIGFIATIFFIMGAWIGRRLSTSVSFDYLRASTRHIHRHLHKLERRMATQTQRLIDEMHNVETKLDGYVSIINASNVFVGGLLDTLTKLEGKVEIDPAVVDAAIDSIETHLAAVGTALTTLATRQVPVVIPGNPASAQPTPVADPTAVDPATPATPPQA